MLGSCIDLGNPVNDHPLNRGLASWHNPLPGRAGGVKQWNDLKGNANPLAFGPTPTTGDVPAWALARPAPNHIPSVKFDGSNDVASKTSYPTTTTDYTFGYWFMRPTASDSRIGLMHYTGGASNNGWRLMHQNTGPNLRFAFGGVADYNLSTLLYTAGNWFYACMRVTGASLTGHIVTPAGKVTTETASLGTISGTPTVLTIGSDPFGGFAFDGYISDVFVYSRFLTDAEWYARFEDSRRGFPKLLRRFSRRAYFFGSGAGSGAGTQTATPGTADVTISGAAPSASGTGTATATPGVGTVTITGVAPPASGTGAGTATPGTATVTVSGVSPAVSGTGTGTATPGSAVVTISGIDATATGGGTQSATPGSADVTVTATAPTASATGSVTTTPGTAAVTISGVAPAASPSGAATATPNVATITIAGVSPSATGSGVTMATPGFAAVTVTAVAPTAGAPPQGNQGRGGFAALTVHVGGFVNGEIYSGGSVRGNVG